MLISAFSLLGLVFSGWSALVHYRLLMRPNYVGPCNINRILNCSDVYLSRFGSIRGVPVAGAGFIFFEAMTLLAISSVTGPEGGGSSGVILAFSTAGLIATLYFAATSWLVLNRWCLLCLGTYVAVAGLFVVSALKISVPFSQLPAHVLTDLEAVARRPATFLQVAVVIASAVAVVRWFPREPIGLAPAGVGAADRTRFEALWRAQPRFDLGIPSGSARVVVVKFMDWQCGSCRTAHLAHAPILAKYAEMNPGAVQSVTKDYPLSNRCNAHISVQGHRAACEAAAAVRLAAEHGQEAEMIHWLFENHVGLTPERVEAEVCRRLGIRNFSAEYRRVLPFIQRDIADASALGVDETPVYYVNGALAHTPGAAYVHPAHLDWAIQYELNKG